MKQKLRNIIFFMFVCCSIPFGAAASIHSFKLSIVFLDDTLTVDTDSSIVVPFNTPLSQTSLNLFYTSINMSNWQALVDTLLTYQKRKQLNDWMYYQLIRRAAQQIAPKSENYFRYTLYKWFLLAKSGYDATLGLGNNQLFFYVLNEENIYEIPFYTKKEKRYMCLNSHDYGKIDFVTDTIREVYLPVSVAVKAFSYKITRLPDFMDSDYIEKDIQFRFHGKINRFRVKLNPTIQVLLTNYPLVDFELYFNIPLSSGTYTSLIEPLKSYVKGMSQNEGIDYLMRFTRYAFLYESDQDNFGKEKHMCPEQTLFFQYSDCDDRAALFFYLVKEIYNLPMIALLYPTHILLAVKLDHPLGKTVLYRNANYSICDPTPQEEDLEVGEVADKFKELPYQIVYEYTRPEKK